MSEPARSPITLWHVVPRPGYPEIMSLPNEINQRDLRMRSREIMDAVEQGERFSVTRDGREIAQLVPLTDRRTFVPSREFVELGRGLTTTNPEKLRADIDSMAKQAADDPYAR